MREESNRVSCIVETGMDKRKGEGSCCFVIKGVMNTTEVTYVVVIRTREL